MNALSIPRHSMLQCYWLEARCEFLRLLRAPSFAIPTLVFPPMFYLLFGLLLARPGGDGRIASYLLATYGVFGVMAPGLFGFGVAMALDRDRGFLALKRALPMPPAAMLVAKLAMAMLFAAIIACVLTLIAVCLAHVPLTLSQLAGLMAVDVLGVVPFCAIGLFVGTVVSGHAAPGVINLMYLPMAFLAGLWMPMSMLPHVLQTLAPVWPVWHLAQIALSVAGAEHDGAIATHILALAAVALVFSTMALRRLARA
ncbi:MAG: transporter permease [Xanthomonadaceae bacterium]|nr:transporter permease [Xanthomonadaceae bacterium]